MARASIRFRITAIATIAVAIVLALGGIAVVVSQRRQLTSTLDTTLRQRASDVIALVETTDPIPDTFGGDDPDGFAQLVGASGDIIAASPNLQGYEAVPIEFASGETLQTAFVMAIDDDPFRVLSRTVETARGGAILHIATSYDVVGDSTEVLTTTLLIAFPILVLLLALIVWWLTGRTLRPVEAIRAEVAAIGGGGLNRRVPEPTTGDEIALLAGTMNEMLGRIEDAVDRQQQFVADASHELRSPLTRMRSEIEADMLESGDQLEHEPSRLASLHEEVVGLQRLVEDLLHLARSDAGHTEQKRVAIDLDDLVIAEARRVQDEGRLEVDMTGVSAAEVAGDPAQLRRAIRNLTDNATRHAASRIGFTLAENDGTATLAVIDDGPGIPAADAERIFERFGRLDDARARASGGTGLGLSITRDIVDRHGGSITLDQSYSDGARLVVTLPLAQASN